MKTKTRIVVVVAIGLGTALWRTLHWGELRLSGGKLLAREIQPHLQPTTSIQGLQVHNYGPGTAITVEKGGAGDLRFAAGVQIKDTHP